MSEASCSASYGGMTDHDAAPSADCRRFCLLHELPEAALELVLQGLDPCSLASTAATCSKLQHIVPAYISKVEVRCKRFAASKQLKNFISWLGSCSRSSSLGKLTQCSIIFQPPNTLAPRQLVLTSLPYAQLLHLRLKKLSVRLAATGDSSGVLSGCTALRVLVLEDCELADVHEDFAAIAALPELQHLRYIAPHDDSCEEQVFPKFQQPAKLTHLSFHGYYGVDTELMGYLSALVNLQHLDLPGLYDVGCPGGWPLQLSQLTCLRVNYLSETAAPLQFDVEQQFQHLSSFSALQHLALSSDLPGVKCIPGIKHLAELTSLQLEACAMEFSTTNTHDWACRTVLQSLTLEDCTVQPEALAAFTQLRALSLDGVKTQGTSTLEQLLHAVSQLPLLTDVFWGRFESASGLYFEVVYPPAAAYTALTASTNLRSLQLHTRSIVRRGWFLPMLFQPGLLYPSLRVINLDIVGLISPANNAFTEQQLHLLCSSCPAVESLMFAPSTSLCFAPTAAWQPLLQLSGLTRLMVLRGLTYSGSAAVVSTTAQLTGLRELSLGLRLHTDRKDILLQLVTLTNLVKLDLECSVGKEHPHRRWHIDMANKAQRFQPPDVWTQLLFYHLKAKKAGCLAWLKHST